MATATAAHAPAHAHAHAHAPAPAHNPGDDYPPRPQAEIAVSLLYCSLCRTTTTPVHLVVGPSCVPCQLWDNYCWRRASGNIGGSGFQHREDSSWTCRDPGHCNQYSCYADGS